jgi:hypothetical protein
LATAATLVGGQPGAAAARAVLQRLAATAIFSLVSFDSKGVYDRVCKETLPKTESKGHTRGPALLDRNFYSNRTATV